MNLRSAGVDEVLLGASTSTNAVPVRGERGDLVAQPGDELDRGQLDRRLSACMPVALAARSRSALSPVVLAGSTGHAPARSRSPEPDLEQRRGPAVQLSEQAAGQPAELGRQPWGQAVRDPCSSPGAARHSAMSRRLSCEGRARARAGWVADRAAPVPRKGCTRRRVRSLSLRSEPRDGGDGASSLTESCTLQALRPERSGTPPERLTCGRLARGWSATGGDVEPDPSSPAAYIHSRRPTGFHGRTAPSGWSARVGTRAATSTLDRTPRPWQAGHGPEESKAKDSALGCSKRAPHTGQVISSLSVAIEGPTRWPFGHRCEPAAASSAAAR